ncbi:ATP-binding protein [Salinispira pacifica]|uniref:histidine kinase n=1 Tax=Salinispira pacifica TaxID=1307761 RepID=V5WJX8_9SPIO|nr:transporter substrate-binding domain-containing protein [Salinispira pacifica]AHC16038.1 Signal transduction histidine kinase [Salinispira pacifica]
MMNRAAVTDMKVRLGGCRFISGGMGPLGLLPVLLGIYFFISPVEPLRSQTLQAAFIPDLYPLSYLDQDGTRTGFYIDLLQALAEELDYEIQYRDGSWGESFQRTVDGDLDLLISVTYTPERDEFLDYVPLRVLTGWTQVILPQNSDVENVIDLQGLSVGVMRGDNNGEAFVDFVGSFEISQPRLIIYDSFSEILTALSAGDLDAGVVQSFTPVENYPRLKRSAIMFNPFHTSYATASGNIPQVIEDMETIIGRWKEQESSPYYRIFNRYFGGAERVVIPPWLTAIMIILILTAVFSWLIVRYLTLALRRSNQSLEELNATLEEKVEQRSRLLEDSRKELLEKEKMAALGNMVAGIAHEVNTPVGVAVTASSYLQEMVGKIHRDYQNDALSQRAFRDFISQAESSSVMIQSNLLRAGELIQSFKEISVDHSVDEPRTINLREYCDSVLLSLSPRLKDCPVEYRLQAEDAELHIRPGSIAQILTNLFENALIHGFPETEMPSSPLISITTGIEQTNGIPHSTPPLRTLKIVVEDNGKGIDPHILPRIYEPFISSKRFEGSSGLGLSIVHNLVVQQLNGTIRAEPRPGRGTCFTIHIPLPD